MVEQIPYPQVIPGVVAPQEVQTVFPQTVMAAMLNVVILIALFSWAFSVAKRAWAGEEIEAPLAEVAALRRGGF